MAENNQTKTKAEIIKLAENEHDFLRGELVHLKDCQVKFLTFSVTATAVIFGIIGRSSLIFSTGSNVPIGGIWLIPLAVLLPAWWIFFDKATTITRIVGYFRLLENIILGEVVPPVYFGWENALERSRKQKVIGKIIDSRLFKILIFRTTHRYWTIIYYIFFFLSWVCFIGGLKEANLLVIIFSGVLVVISCAWNARMLWALIFGKYSYDENARNWKIIHQIPVDKV